MDFLTQVQSNIRGSISGNGGYPIAFRGDTVNVYGLPEMSNPGVGKQSGEFGAEDAAFRPYCLIPHGRNITFTGRKSLIESVKQFSEQKGHNRVALHGLGGSGKTQVALEYVYQRARESDCNIFWVRGSGALEFSEGFRAIARHARIPLASSETDEEDCLLGVRRWFEGSGSGDWILVIDNADNEDDFAANNSPIGKFIPQGTKGTLIFTTRSRQIASRQHCAMIEVGKMGSEEAEELFSKRFGSWHGLGSEEKEVLTMILGSVDHLPLAVVGMAAFMTETETPPSVYWSIFQENEERAMKLLSQKFSDIQREADVTESILGTYFVTFNRITQQMRPAAEILRLMAFLDRQNIPEELLRKCGLEGMDDSVEFRRAIGKLLGFSLVTAVRRENETFYELHRLVQLSLRVYLSTEESINWRAAALQVISHLLPRDRTERQYIDPVYIPHALAVTKNSTDPVAEELCFRMGQYFLDTGSYDNAAMQFRRCIDLREQLKGYDWEGEDLLRFKFLGEVKLYQGKYDESEKMNQRAMEECERVLGPDHPDTLSSINNLAMVLCKQGRYNESETMNRRALESYEKILGPDHPDTLTSLSGLAAVLVGQGKYDESEIMNRRALEGYEKVLGPDHPTTLTSVNNLAMVLREQGKYDELEKMNRRALEGRERILGPDHPNTLASLSNLATVLEKQGKYNELEMMNRRALEGYQKVLGPNHPDTLTSLNNLATMLEKQGRYDESAIMNRRALEGYEKALGPDHPTTLTSLSNLATVLQSHGKYDESETMNRRVLEGREKVLGLDHPTTLTSVHNLAMVLREQGRYDESEMMNRRALEGREKVFGPDHPITLTSVNNLAMVLREQGRYDESEMMNRRVLEGREKVLGPDHPSTLTSFNNLAMVLREQGRYDESEMMSRRALEGREKVFGPDHPATLTSVNNLAVVLREQGKYDESEAMNWRAQEALPIKLDRTGPRSTGRRVMRFLRSVMSYKDDGRTERHTVP